MGFGSSNERGGIEEEAMDDSSPVDTPESHSAADKRRKPALKLDEAGSSKKPRCAYTSILDQDDADLQWTTCLHLVPAQETVDVMVQAVKLDVKAALHSTTISPMSITSWHRPKASRNHHEDLTSRNGVRP